MIGSKISIISFMASRSCPQSPVGLSILHLYALLPCQLCHVRRLSSLVFSRSLVRKRRRRRSDTFLLSVARQILHNIHSGGRGRLSVWWALVGNGLIASCLAYKPHECRYSCRGSRFLGRLLSACQFLLSFCCWFSVMVVADSLRQDYHVVV